MKKNFEEWLGLNEDECNIYFAETGMDRELDFDLENELERCYEKYEEELIKEQQMEAWEKNLKETDSGHRPC